MKIYGSLKVTFIVAFLCAAFGIGSSAQTLTTIYDFCTQYPCPDGAAPEGTLVQGHDGNFYGTTSDVGFSGQGTVFKLTSSGTLTILHSFTGLSDGGVPRSGLIQASDGNFYGDTEGGGVCGVAYRVTPSGTLTPLHEFAGGASDGCQPFGPLVQASDGNFYGTTYLGGAPNFGTVFKMMAGGTVTILHVFCTQSGCPDGYNPTAGLVQGSDGNLYGETLYGGPNGYGSIFKITTSGTLTTLASFSSTNGSQPSGGLVQGHDGNFYGTTSQGGAAGGQAGTVFKMTSSGTLTTLYNFCSQSGCADGAASSAGLLQATDGNFYGTTGGGGTHGSGTVFAITSDGSFSSLYSFCSLGGASCTDGAYPYVGLIQGTDGKLYGVTTEGGNANYAGTAFSLQINENTLTVSVVGLGTVTSTDGFINCPGTCSHIYQHNANVTLNATPAGGWTLGSWGGACSGNGSCNVTMSQNQSVSATFTQNTYSLTVSATGNGSVTSTDGFINCPGTCSHVYLSNTLVGLSANPAPGWSLSSWGGACNGNGSCTVDMTQNQSVSATFTQNSYSLTVSISGSGTINSTDGFIRCPGSCSHTYLSLTQVTLNESPDQGWSFTGWSGACSGLGACSFPMLQNSSVSAFFVQPGNGDQFTAVTPCRLVDTRTGYGGGGPIQGGTFQTFNLPQLAQTKGCANLSSASLYSLNVTLVPFNGGRVGFLTIWPAGLAQPGISTMNSLDGRIKANAAIVMGGSSGGVSVYVSGTSDVLLDIDGYFSPPGGSTLAFYPLTPCRVVDTRNANGDLAGPYLLADQERDFPVIQSSCIPQGPGIAAYSFNVTAVPHPTGQRLGFLTVWPQGGSRPNVSTLNNLTGTIVANAAIVPSGIGGGVAVYPNNDTDLLIDIDGYFGTPASGGLSLYPVPPCRVLDTRNGNGAFQNELTVSVAGSVCAPSSSAEAYVLNATVVPQPTLGFLTLWADGQQRPTASTLNAKDGAITSNMAVVPTNNGSIDAYANNLTQLILDISSYFAP